MPNCLVHYVSHTSLSSFFRSKEELYYVYQSWSISSIYKQHSQSTHALSSSKAQSQIYVKNQIEGRTGIRSANKLRTSTQRATANILVTHFSISPLSFTNIPVLDEYSFKNCNTSVVAPNSFLSRFDHLITYKKYFFQSGNNMFVEV
jgi:hypothetical protein